MDRTRMKATTNDGRPRHLRIGLQVSQLSGENKTKTGRTNGTPWCLMSVLLTSLLQSQ